MIIPIYSVLVDYSDHIDCCFKQDNGTEYQLCKDDKCLEEILDITQEMELEVKTTVLTNVWPLLVG
jgi:hypothetical protein